MFDHECYVIDCDLKSYSFKLLPTQATPTSAAPNPEHQNQLLTKIAVPQVLQCAHAWQYYDGTYRRVCNKNHGTNLVALEKPLLTVGFARWSERLSSGDLPVTIACKCQAWYQ